MNGDMNDTQNVSGQNNNGYTTYPANNYNGPVVVSNAIPEKSGKYAVASLACGIISIVLFWSVLIGLAIGIAGIVFGIINLAKKRPLKGIAIAGIITSVLGVLIGFAFLLLYIVAVAYM